ncbi:MAG: YolD-like family protein [Bacillota bacterium]
MSDIVDRGNKKWVSLMIPELREGLHRLFQEEIRERPELDEQEVERLNWLLIEAFQNGRPVQIRYWEDGERVVCGRIAGVGMGTLRVMTAEGKVEVPVKHIVDVQ